jgi:hypothetical protein
LVFKLLIVKWMFLIVKSQFVLVKC